MANRFFKVKHGGFPEEVNPPRDVLTDTVRYVPVDNFSYPDADIYDLCGEEPGNYVLQDMGDGLSRLCRVEFM